MRLLVHQGRRPVMRPGAGPNGFEAATVAFEGGEGSSLLVLGNANHFGLKLHDALPENVVGRQLQLRREGLADEGRAGVRTAFAPDDQHSSSADVLDFLPK